jgi:hypothetical protein
MRYKTLRWGIVLVSIGLWCLARGIREIDDDLTEPGALAPADDERYCTGYAEGRLRGLAEAREAADERAEQLLDRG